MADRKDTGAPEKTLAAVCGLYCGACAVYIATHLDPSRKPALARQFGLAPDELACDGCRSTRKPRRCVKCMIYHCASAREVEFCVECGEYPCLALREFQKQKPHRGEIFEDLDQIRAEGWDKWMPRVRGRYTCIQCGKVNSAYDVECWECGKTPSCGFVARHRKAIEAFLKGG